MATVNWKTHNMYKPNNTWQGQVYTPSKFNSKTSPYVNHNYTNNYVYDVTGAKTALNKHNANKPGEYQSNYQGNINGLIDNLSNRKKFSYNSTGDALYQMYKDRAVAQGKLSMKDSMGQAAANTGGFGNSYAQTVGQQSNNASMNELQNRVPELAQMALNQYQTEGDNMLNLLNMYQNQDATEYGRHRDTVTDWQTERDRLTDFYLAQQQLDRSAFDSDRAFNQAAWEFAENQRYNAWSDAENRKQSQINANNSNSLAKWQQQWNNYWNGENQNVTNEANALDMLYKLAMMEQDEYYITGF